MARLLTLFLSVCALVGVPAAASAVDDPDPPNIVVFYIDDVSPHDGRLWSDPALTPTIHDLFVAHGQNFTNAIAETPLCCPGRAGALTGLHTHNHNVVVNDGRLFRPGMHVGTALTNAGYTTMFIGKYLNQNNKFTPEQWAAHQAGWTHLDAIVGTNGKFLDYKVQTRDGRVYYPDVHSTRMVAERTVEHLQATPASSPVFAVLSVYNMHSPNTPMPEYATDPRCNAMPPFRGANFNEEDVSDKHPVVAALPMLPYADGWPMVTYCREMLGVEWLVKTVTDALAAEGRLDNTLLVFTADNGVHWGAHRLGQTKQTAFATPVPLYMHWPQRWGDAPREITDAVSNIDLAPTFCSLAGEACALGPYPTGQEHPDGVSLLPVLDDPTGTTHLGRDAVLEEGSMLPSGTAALAPLPIWHGLRTSVSSPLGWWHYVEYKDGFRELYDLAADPDELVNVSSDPDHADLIAQLHLRLYELVHEGRTPQSFNWPDAEIAVSPGGTFKGADFYTNLPNAAQTQKIAAETQTTNEFVVRVNNRFDEPATFRVLGKATGARKMTVSYWLNGANVSNSVRSGNRLLADVPGGGSVDLVIRVHVGEAAIDAKKTVNVTTFLAADALQYDVVRAIVVRAPPPP